MPDLTVSSAVDTLLQATDQAGLRTAAGLGSLATQSGTFSGTSSGTNTGDQTTVSGNAGTATALAASRMIDGVSFDGTANIKLPEVIQIQCSDLSTLIEAGTGKAVFRMPFAGTLTAVRASVSEAPTGSAIVLDINESGTTVLSTKLSIDASEKTSTTAATAAVISDSSLADDAEITIDFDQVGSSTAGKGVVVTLYVTKT